MLTRISLLIALPVVGAVAAAGTAIAGSSGSDSQVTISPRAVVAVAGQPSPVDVGGVPAVRAGKRIPARYVLIGRHVRLVRGTEAGLGALTMRCPAGKTCAAWRVRAASGCRSIGTSAMSGSGRST
jgi:hypothetical protein